MNTFLDPILKHESVDVQPETLLEPEASEQQNQKGLRYRLSRYGNRVLVSAERFLTAAVEAARNIGTALAGSIILLPLVIVARGVSVLSHGLLDLIKPLVLSTVRLFFEVLHGVIAPVRNLFLNFNKYVLFPLLKRIREDDAAALIAFVVLIAVIVLIVFLLSALL